MEKEVLGPEPGSVGELRALIDQALMASDAAGESIVGCYLQMALDTLEDGTMPDVISRRMQ